MSRVSETALPEAKRTPIWQGEHGLYIGFESVTGMPAFVGLGRPHLESLIESQRIAFTEPDRPCPWTYEIAGPFVLDPRRPTATVDETVQRGWEAAVWCLSELQAAEKNDAYGRKTLIANLKDRIQAALRLGPYDRLAKPGAVGEAWAADFNAFEEEERERQRRERATDPLDGRRSPKIEKALADLDAQAEIARLQKLVESATTFNLGRDGDKPTQLFVCVSRQYCTELYPLKPWTVHVAGPNGIIWESKREYDSQAEALADGEAILERHAKEAP